MKTYTILAILFSISILACNSGKIEEHGHGQMVMLNHGEKWQANPETTSGITNMKLLVTNYTSKKDCDRLHTSLVSEFESIIQQCTMTGEAHEQLHNYLIPLQERIKAVEGKSGEECDQAVKAVNDFLSAYEQYFV